MPLPPNVLDKLGIPGARGVAAFAPVKNKFGDRILDKIGVDTAFIGENLECVLRGTPLARDRHLGAAALIF